MPTRKPRTHNTLKTLTETAKLAARYHGNPTAITNHLNAEKAWSLHKARTGTTGPMPNTWLNNWLTNGDNH